MKVLIVEDEELAAERLQSLLTACDPTVEISAVMDTVAETVAFFKSGGSADLLMLDIELADGKSFAIFDEVVINHPVIFTTAYDHYALQSFKFFSLDYLLKPVQQEDLQRALLKVSRLNVASNLRHDEVESLRQMLVAGSGAWKERFLIRSGNKIQFKYARDVAFFFADGKTVYLVPHGENRRYVVDHTLEDLENILNPDQFFRINRKYIVAIECLREVRPQLNGKLELRMNQEYDHELSVSRERAGDFKAWLDR